MAKLTDEEIEAMPMDEVLKNLQIVTAKAMLRWMQDGDVHPRDLAGINQMLKNNDIKEEKKVEDSMGDRIRKALED